MGNAVHCGVSLDHHSAASILMSSAATVIYSSLQPRFLLLLLLLLSSLLRLGSFNSHICILEGGMLVLESTDLYDSCHLAARKSLCGAHKLSLCLLASPSLWTEAFRTLASASNCTHRKHSRLNQALKLMLERAHTKIKPKLCMSIRVCKSIICILPMRETGESVCQGLPLGEDAKWCFRSLK